jgi:ABC-2 type transport system permease protein
MTPNATPNGTPDVAPDVTIAAEDTTRPSRPSRPVLLVAGREIRERTRAKSFKITTIISLLAVAAAVIVPHVLSSKNKTVLSVGLVGQLPGPVEDAVRGTTGLTGVKVRTVTVPDRASAEAQIRQGQLDVAVTGDAVIVKRTFSDTDTSSRAQLTRALASSLGLLRGLQANAIDVSAAQRALASPPVPVQGLVAPTPTRDSQRTTALLGNILLYVFLSLYGTWILMGVVEEKTSRVVEVLLATLRPRQLLAGKVLGIGAVALIQGLLIVTTALVCAAATGSNYLKGTNVSLLGQTFMWFLLGFAFYAMLYGAAGSMVSRQSEAQNAAFPVTVPLLVAYLFAFTVLPSNHGNMFLTVLSFFPPTAPIAMPARVAVGGAGLLDVAISTALMLVAIVWLARVAGTVYSRAILRTGKKTTWREVLRRPAPTT